MELATEICTYCGEDMVPLGDFVHICDECAGDPVDILDGWLRNYGENHHEIKCDVHDRETRHPNCSCCAHDKAVEES